MRQRLHAVHAGSQSRSPVADAPCPSLGGSPGGGGAGGVCPLGAQLGVPLCWPWGLSVAALGLCKAEFCLTETEVFSSLERCITSVRGAACSVLL